MRIIKPGPGWSVEVNCTGKGMGGGGCGALLEVVPGDLIRVYGGGYTESDPYTAIKCMQCNKRTCLEDMGIKIPSAIAKDIRKD